MTPRSSKPTEEQSTELPEKEWQRLFTRHLMHWHCHHNERSLPWKNEQDPYRIWLSEVILQQTRARQGLPYYLKFIEAFPDVYALASAQDAYVFRLWQGLGYYSRCRNMLATARYIVDHCDGKFPSSYEGLLGLKGIGPYTAAAISSFAFGLPQAVVDGNVYRVLARCFGIDIPSDSTEGKKYFTALAAALLDREDSAGFNQAIMDLGATVCTPLAPLCEACPLNKQCFAFRQNAVSFLPVKSKKVKVRQRYFHYLVIHTDQHVWIRKRQKKDIWLDLHEPFLIETNQALDMISITQTEAFRALKLPHHVDVVYDSSATQRLTHQLIETRFFMVELKRQKDVELPEDGFWILFDDLKKIAFPKTLVAFFQKKLYF